MLSRSCPLLLLTVLALASPVLSQPLPDPLVIRPVDLQEQRPSHRPLDIGLERNLRPEEALASRLRDPRQLKQLRDQLGDAQTDADIARLARNLLRDEKFIESLKGKFSRDDLEGLLGKVGGASGLGSDPALQKLIREAIDNKSLGKEQEALFRRWGEKLRDKGVVERPTDAQPPQPGTPPTPLPTPPTPPPAGNTPPQPNPALPTPPASTDEAWRLDPQTRQWLTQNLERWSKDFDRFLDSPRGQSWRDSLRNFSARMQQNVAPSPQLLDRARGLSRFLPSMRNVIPRSAFRRMDATLPTVPRMSFPSLGLRGGAPSAAGTGRALLWLILAGAAAFLLYRLSGWYKQTYLAPTDEWRPGPWPVRPDQVRTRADLIRAFEHLALVLLGRPARTQHHRDLAAQIGQQPALDQDRRREAAAELAQAYEHARYRPEQELLPEAELRRARRDLSYLAGEAAA